MKKTLAFMLGILVIAALVVGCAKQPAADIAPVAQETTDNEVADISGDVEGIEDIDEELDLGELATLDEDLDNLI